MMMNQNKAAYFIIAFITLTSYESFCQTKGTGGLTGVIGDSTQRIITTAVPFLTISPDSRSGALGDAGVALSPDANSTYWNPAKLVFAKEDYAASLSYTPWLRNLVNDMSISYLSGYTKLKNKSQAIGASLTYFNLGSIAFTDQSGNPIRDFRPREFAISVSGVQKLSDKAGLSVTLRYIHSNLAGNIAIDPSTTTKAGNTATGDIAFYYKDDIKIGGEKINLAFGANISNVGSKITYSTAGRREFVPTNLKLGTAITYNVDVSNSFSLILDFNKLMVPTPHGGKDPAYLNGVINSFGDAPGGFKEEMQEINICSGIEYWYEKLFAVRAGYFYENPHKGNRKFLTVGAGFHYGNFGLDMAYLIPNQRQSPLAETLRFTIHVKFEKTKPLVLPEERPEEVVN